MRRGSRSLPSRGAWIEMFQFRDKVEEYMARRSPRGERG